MSDLKDPISIEHEENQTKEVSALTNTEGEDVVVDKRAERRFVWKADLRILTMISAIYLLSSLDRSDIGNAAVAGMTKSLHLTPSQLSTAVSLFYPSYIVFLPVGTLLVRTLPPPFQLAIGLVWWGSATACLAAVHNAAQLTGVRFVVGAGEALGQCGVFYLSLWYNRKELVTRTSIVFAMSALASMFGGLIAYGVQKNLSHAHGILAWQWLFIIEGCVSVGFSVAVLLLLPPLPEKLKGDFTEKEKQIALRRQKEAHMDPGGKRFDPSHIPLIFKDPKFYGFALIYICANVPFASFSTFLPIIVRALDFPALETQLLVVPVFATAAISSVTVGILSDTYQQRSIPTIACFLLTSLGYVLQLTLKSPGARYGALYLVAIGAYPPIVICNAWTAGSILGYTKRALTTALVVVCGQCINIMATREYDDPPRFTKGHGIALSFALLGAVVTGVMFVYLHRCNVRKREEQGSERARLDRGKGFDEICDDHPDFFYVT